MEELFPILIFIIVVAVNALKFFAGKSGRKPPAKKPGQQPKQGPSTLEEFFDEIAQKLEPQPREPPEWPKDIVRPDYMKEMEEYETEQASSAPPFQAEELVAEIPVAEAEPAQPARVMAEPAQPRAIGKVATFKMPAQGAAFTGLTNMHISMPPLLRSASGKTDFELKNKEKLKQALIASMVFGSPRAYDTSFNNTMAN